ncbi:hypothetical protein Tco_1357813 [Tanacetum coccineum]
MCFYIFKKTQAVLLKQFNTAQEVLLCLVHEVQASSQLMRMKTCFPFFATQSIVHKLDNDDLGSILKLMILRDGSQMERSLLLEKSRARPRNQGNRNEEMLLRRVVPVGTPNKCLVIKNKIGEL